MLLLWANMSRVWQAVFNVDSGIMGDTYEVYYSALYDVAIVHDVCRILVTGRCVQSSQFCVIIVVVFVYHKHSKHA